MPFILHAIIDNEKRIARIVNQGLRQLPKVAHGVTFALKVVANSIVTHTLQMRGEVATGVVDGRTHQILDVLLFRDHK